MRTLFDLAQEAVGAVISHENSCQCEEHQNTRLTNEQLLALAGTMLSSAELFLAARQVFICICSRDEEFFRDFKNEVLETVLLNSHKDGKAN